MKKTLAGWPVAMLAALSCAPAAFSQDPPSTKWYVGADVGTAKNGVSDYANGTVSARDEKSTAFRLRAGYRFVKYFALEAGVSDLGSYSSDVQVDCGNNADCIGDFRSDVDLRAFNLSGVARLPLGDRFALHAQLGWMLREKSTHQVPVAGDDYSLDSHKVLPTFGVGASFAATRRLEIFAEWSKFVGDDPGIGAILKAPGAIMDESDVEAFSLGVRWLF